MIQMRFTGTRRPIAHVTVAIIENGKEINKVTLPFRPEQRGRKEPVFSRLGYDWGADNESTVELARAILRRVYPQHYANVLNETVYRQFAAKVLAGLSRDAFELTDAEIQAWVGGTIR